MWSKTPTPQKSKLLRDYCEYRAAQDDGEHLDANDMIDLVLFIEYIFDHYDLVDKGEDEDE